jgi:hypothetical protein
MGACGSSCCGGRFSRAIKMGEVADLMRHTGKSRDGLYEPVLAESEREAVADLLQYLENVRSSLFESNRTSTYTVTAWRDGFLFWRTSQSLKYPCFFRQCRSSTQCELDICRNHGTRYVYIGKSMGGSRSLSQKLLLPALPRNF